MRAARMDAVVRMDPQTGADANRVGARIGAASANHGGDDANLNASRAPTPKMRSHQRPWHETGMMASAHLTGRKRHFRAAPSSS
jgi:hypothetical protein